MNKQRYFYVLRKPNPKAKYNDTQYQIDKYLYIHGKLSMWGAEYDIASATLFNSKEEAEQYKATHVKAKDYNVYEVDPRKHCLSETSCDDCSWGGVCPRHPKG